MPLTKPTTLPEFAKEDDANISEPIVDLKDNGWVDEEIPTAKNWNWFAHWVSKWMAWINQRFTNESVVNVTFNAGNTVVLPTGKIYWQRQGDFIHIHIRDNLSAVKMSGISSSTNLTIVKVGGGALDFLTGSELAQYIPVLIHNNDVDEIGNVYIAPGDGTAIGVLRLNSALFTIPGEKGICNQSFRFYSPLP